MASDSYKSAEIEKRPRWIHALGFALGITSLIALADLALDWFCIRLSLLLYLAGMGVGALLGAVLGQKMSTRGKLLARKVFYLLAATGLPVLIWLAISIPMGWNPTWDSKCSWRLCNRIPGYSLFTTPFPVGKVSCEILAKCMNEYPFTRGDLDEVRAGLLEHIKKQNCPPP